MGAIADRLINQPAAAQQLRLIMFQMSDVVEEGHHGRSGAIAFRVTRAQGFTEGNKRTAVLLARWTLDNNGLDGSRIIDPHDRELAGRNVEAEIFRFFADRA